jgi:predicted DNA-binding protein (MmcQ/YjbR family)
MELEQLRRYLLEKKGVTEEQPFGPEALVFKVVGKMFGLIAWQASPLSLSLKCDPDLAVTLRSQYPAITPGYHLNKKHWNSIALDGTVPDDEVLGLIDHSYNLVVKGLKKAEREQLGT